MKTISIRIQDSLRTIIKEAVLSSANESVIFLTAKYFETPRKIIFIANEAVPANERDYLNRGELHLKVSPLYVNRAISQAEKTKGTVIMIHSHPFETGKPRYSPTDDFGEAQTSETISKCLIGNPPVASMLVGQNQFNARSWTGLSKKRRAANLTILGGKHFVFESEHDRDYLNDDSFLDRQIQAIGQGNQKILSSLEIGIVGLGGTGSNVAEQLVRMGVKKLVLVDLDRFEKTNLSRLYGSAWKDTSRKRFKTDLVTSYLEKINPDISCRKINKSVLTNEALLELSNCDIIFSCLDRHAPRAVLNELSYQCYIPIIDLGIGLVKKYDRIVGGSVRATIVGPGMPCLFCQEIIRPDIISAEYLTPEKYKSLRAEGYVSDLQNNVPSVISYTTLASSLGVILFLDSLTSENHDLFSTLLFDISTKQTMKFKIEPKEDCVCQKRLGKGMDMPFSIAD